jgi:hypothetical protein
MGQISYSDKHQTNPIGERLTERVDTKGFGTFTIPEAKKPTKYGGWVVDPALEEKRVGGEIGKVAVASQELDTFGIDNVRKLRQMGFNPDQINTYIKAQTFNVNNIQQFTESEQNKNFGEKPTTETTPTGFTTKIATSELESSQKKENYNNPFTGYQQHAIKIITKSLKNKELLKDGVLTEEEANADKKIRVLRTFLGNKTRPSNPVNIEVGTLNTEVVPEPLVIIPEIVLKKEDQEQKVESLSLIPVNTIVKEIETVETPTIINDVPEEVSLKNIEQVENVPVVENITAPSIEDVSLNEVQGNNIIEEEQTKIDETAEVVENETSPQVFKNPFMQRMGESLLDEGVEEKTEIMVEPQQVLEQGGVGRITQEITPIIKEEPHEISATPTTNQEKINQRQLSTNKLSAILFSRSQGDVIKEIERLSNPTLIYTREVRGNLNVPSNLNPEHLKSWRDRLQGNEKVLELFADLTTS